MLWRIPGAFSWTPPEKVILKGVAGLRFIKSKKRLQLYSDLIKENPLYSSFVCRTEAETDLSMKKLYLYGFVPAIMEFAGWVLEEAVRTGKKRL